jgi:hypothetical protein
VAILNITLLGPTPNNAAAQWEWTPIGSAPFYQSLFRHGDQFGADASDDFLTAGDVFNAEGGTNVVAEFFVAPPRVAVVERLICGWLAGCGPRAK